jgi:cobalt-precorrin-5B (C1)-methyltransferase
LALNNGRRLRKGITTGTCAAAGAKAATQALFSGIPEKRPGTVSVTLPSGGSIEVKVKDVRISGSKAVAIVIKDAGDDPDATNGAEIVAEVEVLGRGLKRPSVRITGGKGVGTVTRPGLKVRPGRPAINPVPMKMIRLSVIEAAKEAGVSPSIRVTVSVPAGEAIALKTMNARLGIVGGISILGTTGIVEPLSLSAYRHSIKCALDVAAAGGCPEVVFSTGRGSEKAVQRGFRFPPMAFILTGDHMGYALREAGKMPAIERASIAGQFGKFTKLAAGRFETHCADAAIDLEFIAGVAGGLGAKARVMKRILGANTAREGYFILKEEGLDAVINAVCRMVRDKSEAVAGGRLKVTSVLVGYDDAVECVCAAR